MSEIAIWIAAIAVCYLLCCALYAVGRLFVILYQSTAWFIRNGKHKKKIFKNH